jgi:hypothetical protein
LEKKVGRIRRESLTDIGACNHRNAPCRVMENSTA